MRINVQGKELDVRERITLLELAEELGLSKELSVRPLLAYTDGRLRELRNHVPSGASVRFVGFSDREGYDTYRRSGVMLLLAAFERLYGKAVSDVVLHFAIGSGFYFTFGNGIPCDAAFTEKLTREMEILRDAALPFEKRSVPTADARKLFRDAGMTDKDQLFRTRVISRVNIYSLGGYEDYYYGYMAPDTSVLTKFELLPYRDGAALLFPERKDPSVIPSFVSYEKLMDAELEGEEWAMRQGISTVADLNERIICGGTDNTLLIAEAMQEGRIADIAFQIKKRGGVKFVMIAGPSSSGKTTFSQRLCTQLSACGLVPHYIGTDNYFINREDMPVGPDGKRDFEALSAVDVTQFNTDMSALLRGERVELPTFDFVEGKRVYQGNDLSLGEEDLLVIEGIHGLNDELSISLPAESKFRIYISALTQINIDRHNRVPASDGRLLRRIVRDFRTRGYSAAQTLAMWESVRAGEMKNIFPYQESADVVFNSALPYEIAVLKTYAQPLLFQVEEDDPSYQEAKRLLKFLDYFIAIPSEGIAGNSILREFIGGGCFHL